jgi:hypothetical protein
LLELEPEPKNMYKVLNFHIIHLKVVGAGAASFARAGANDPAPKNKTM